jgi:oligopeptide/dipeptide ABC transporter ATP-binding protein
MGLQNGLLGVRDERREIISIPGVPPNLINPPSGCRFHPRCPFAAERCIREEPGLEEMAPGHRCACHFYPNASLMRLEAKKTSVWTEGCFS